MINAISCVLLGCLNFLGARVLGVIDAFWAGIDAAARLAPGRAATSLAQERFKVTVGELEARLVQKGKILSLFGVIGMSLATMTAHGAVIAQYSFTGNLQSSDSQLESTANDITKGTGIPNSIVVGNATFKFDKQDTALSFSTLNNDYIEFTVTANAGKVLNLNGGTLTYDVRSGGNSKQVNWVVRSSVGNFGSDLATGSTSSATFAGTTNNLTGVGFDNLSSITFRVYGWKTDNEDLFFDNLTLNGSVVTPVPEPVHFALAGFGLLFFGIQTRRFWFSSLRS